MSVIPLPSKVHFQRVPKLQLLRSGLSLRSRYTGKRQAVNFPFALWYLEGTLLPMEGLDAGEWRAFLTDLEGQLNTFRLPVPGSSRPLSGYEGNATIGAGGVAARSRTAPIAGPASTLLLRKGDYFNIGDELKVASGPVTTDGAGQAAVVFQPSTRKAYAAGVTVTVQDPFLYVSAAADDSATWSLDRPVKHGIKLMCVEAVE